jgi:trehalose 6-phosphate synthase
VIHQNVGRDDFVWVHDYHLMSTGQALRELGMQGRIGFFLHIPFPSLDIFAKLPWRLQVLRAFLAYDVVGFQTDRDHRNFMHCVRTLLGNVTTTRKGERATIRTPDRCVRAGAFPISIDYQQFAQTAADPDVLERAERLHSDVPCPKIILGLDRLDYTKGIPNRMHAFRNALARHAELQRQVSLVQIVVPSREDIPMYQSLKAEIEGLVGQINGQFTQSGWVPVHYIYRSVAPAELAASYRCADVGLITPLKDGMNLVAKEYCACSVNNDSVLILSEFAGAAYELGKGALLVNPYDIEGVADAIRHAVNMSVEERRARMRRLRRTIRRHDIFAWVNSFLRESVASDPDLFTPIERQPSMDGAGGRAIAPRTAELAGYDHS